MSQRVLLLTQYYPPDTAGTYTADLCAHWAAKGHAVTVVTATPNYSAESIEASLEEIRDGVRIIRIPLGEGGARVGFRNRIRGYRQYQMGAAKTSRGLLSQSRFDVVVAVSTPPLIGLTASSLARRSKARFAYILHDIHPDIVKVTGGFRLPASAFRLWDRLHRRVLRAAWRVAVVTEGMKSTLVEDKGISAGKIRVVPLYGLPELVDLKPSPSFVERLGFSNRPFVVLYGGNMGHMHPLDPLLDAAARLQDEGVAIVFVGGGVRASHVRSRIEREGLANVRCLGRLPDAEYEAAIASADVCVVSLEKGAERLASPSRAYTFLSAGRPIMAMMSPEADLAREAETRGYGWQVEGVEEIVALARRLRDSPSELLRAGRASRSTYLEKYSKEKVLRNYDRSFEL